ncbi:hypothetical protein EI546_15500 [Aequorivita sp. H23M31]|uniref:Lipocalin-like domain-containing protein n=1 Tax=Aequorivita ciconiae TaxID=2494375 RepID=A0A410G6Z0_9FLAO|nr:hypothetical protein [Aequorivita sp. H23M31]QAA83032.1 hypothetical protein EI546_15500 [Aequorivita sp. H23M31]
MKKLLVIFSMILFFSCSSDDDAGDVVTTKFEKIKTILPQGEWIVSNFYDNGDQTIDFESFIFTFKTDGTVFGQNDLFTENGTWEYSTTAVDGEQLLLQFQGTVPFDRIIGVWDIISLTPEKVELSIGNVDNQNVKLLIFTQI